MASGSKTKGPDLLQDFGTATELVGKRQYKKAQSALTSLRKKTGVDNRLTSRIDSYLKICQRALRGAAGPAADGEAAYDGGVFAHNQGDLETARTDYKAALKKVSEKDSAHILFALAATEARAGEKTAPLTYLKKALQIDPNVRFLAFGDADFRQFRQVDAFNRLIELPE